MKRSLLQGVLVSALGAAACAPPLPPQPLPDAPQQSADPADTSAARSALGPTPVPISGGTLLISSDGATALAADSDQDRVFLVNLTRRQLLSLTPLRPKDEPGRATEDAQGRFHVVLRGSDAVATIDRVTGTVQRRTPVCSAPRGITYDQARGEVLVACMSGQLTRLDPSGERPPVTVMADPQRDLRDVLVVGGQTYVSRFRSAQVVRLDEGLSPALRLTPLARKLTDAASTGGVFSPAVAWRTLALPDKRLLVLHQMGSDDSLPVDTGRTAPGTPPVRGGYGSPRPADPCASSVVRPFLSILNLARGTVKSTPIARSALVVDMALAPGGLEVALVAAGNSTAGNQADALLRVTLALLDQASEVSLQLKTAPLLVGAACAAPSRSGNEVGDSVSVAYGASGPVVLKRDPVALKFADGQVLELAKGLSHEGHSGFHKATPLHIACASCHPEARDDGRVWSFTGLPTVRTPSSRGGLLATAPFHWTGDMPTFKELAHQVLAGRMGGDDAHADEIGLWMDKQPAQRLPSLAMDPAAVERGKRLFADEEVGCQGCHSGAQFTNSKSEDVGTGGPFQVPQLTGLSSRAPYMHDGCAATLRDRFSPTCGGERHGKTAQLSAAQLDDLLSYLETL